MRNTLNLYRRTLALPTRRLLFSAGLIFMASSGLAPESAQAQTRIGPIDAPQLEYEYGPWASPDKIYLHETPNGQLAVVQRGDGDAKFTVRHFDPVSHAQVGATRTISFAGWPIWGGFLAGEDGHYYVLVGRDNPQEKSNYDVVAVRRYSPTFDLLGTAYIKGGASQGIRGIKTPFAFGHPHMVLTGSGLVVHMSRIMFRSDDGRNHQANLTFEVDLDTMTATPFEELGGYAYSSHSFQQFVALHGSDLVTVDHGDAYPRAIQLGVMNNYPADRTVTEYYPFEFAGETGENATGAAVTGLISGPQGIVVVGSSVRDGSTDFDEARNAFALAADPSGQTASDLQWFSNFPSDGRRTALEARAAMVAPDRWAVLFGVQDRNGYSLEYRLIDSAANVYASTSFPGIFYTTLGDPLTVGTSVFWVGNPNGRSALLYELDVSDPTNPTLRGDQGSQAPPEGSVSVKGRLRAGKPIALRVRANKPVRVVAEGKIVATKRPKGAKREALERTRRKLTLGLRQVTAEIAEGEQATLKLKPRAQKKARRLGRAVKRARARAKARITVTFTDQTGDRDRAKLNLKLR